ncbi:MAG: AAA-like domain-containing protein [Ardenticatenaceae bacterium]|nr:AAA-like domain-containing protein [Ardenticatenaceae bacterium]
MADPSAFFRAGGALAPNAHSYITRKADNELLSAILDGAYCHVLDTRQVGKSSLIKRTFWRLEHEFDAGEYLTIDIDLTIFGRAPRDKWIYSFIAKLVRDSQLDFDLSIWWETQQQHADFVRLQGFLTDVLLTSRSETIVIGIDEIDFIRELDFSDEFFAVVRALYNGRASNPDLNRLVFVLLGTVAPQDLIRKKTITPFNIGTSIKLREITLEEGHPFAAALPEPRQQILERIFYWTNGHPYLTQKIGSIIAKKKDETWSLDDVDEVIASEFFIEKLDSGDVNLQYASSRTLAKSWFERQRLLTLYQQIYQNKRLPANDDQFPLQNELKLAGLIRTADNGQLEVRNRIYRHVFDEQWVQHHLSKWWRFRYRLGWMLFILVLILGSIFFWQQLQQNSDEFRAANYIEEFATNVNPAVRLRNLANLFELEGFQSEGEGLFYELSLEEQIALFATITPDLADEAETVIRHTYYGLSAVDVTRNVANTAVLEAMSSALQQLPDSENSNLLLEVNTWQRARNSAAAGDFETAYADYQFAQRINENNPLLAYETGQLALLSGDMNGAAAAFETALTLNSELQPWIIELVNTNPVLIAYIWGEPEQLAQLPTFVNTPTSTFTPTATWTPTNTPTPSPTPTFTATPTNTPTATFTPTPTWTPSSTPTFTPTAPLGLNIVVPVSGAEVTSPTGVEVQITGTIPEGTKPFLFVQAPNEHLFVYDLFASNTGVNRWVREGVFLGIDTNDCNKSFTLHVVLTTQGAVNSLERSTLDNSVLGLPAGLHQSITVVRRCS